MTPNRNFFKTNTDIIASLILASIFYLVVFGSKSLDPRNYQWLIREGDLGQNYLGGVVYRSEPWHWPILVSKNLAYPYGASVLSTDSLPIMALLFKCLTSLFGLSPYYQFFGIWLFICLLLQAFFSVKITRKIFATDDTKPDSTILIIFSSLFFLISPIMLQRAFGHPSLVTHWTILAAIFLYLNNKLGRREWLCSNLLVAITFLVHPYFTFLALSILAALVCKKVFHDGEVSLKTAIGYGFTLLLTLIIVIYLLGMFSSNPNAGGWKRFSMNLNAPINSMDGSLFLNGLGVADSQSEGYNYLGLGVILGLILLLFQYSADIFSKKNLYENREIVLLCLFLTVFALSSDIYLGNNLIFSYNSIIMRAIGGIFRAAGRAFWPVWYLLLYFMLFGLKKYCGNRVKFIVPILCLIQLLDLAPLYLGKGAFVKNSIEASLKKENMNWNRLQSAKWDDLFGEYRHVFLVTSNPDALGYQYFWDKIVSNGITVNTGYFARITGKVARDLEQVRSIMSDGHLPDYPDTIYIIDDNFYKKLQKTNNKLLAHVEELDGFRYILGDSNTALGKTSKIAIESNKKIDLTKNDGGIVFDGFSCENEAEQWSVHHNVNMKFRLAELPKKDFKIKFEVTPYIRDKNPRVGAIISVNGKRVARWYFKKDKKYPDTTLSVPANLIKDDGNVEIKFRLWGTNSDKRLKIGGDGRRKGLGLKTMEIGY